MQYKRIILVLLVYLLTIDKSYAFINCQGKYDSDSRALSSLKGSCGVCHINPSGSGPQNEFGKAFKAAGFMITDDLVTQFPQLFKKPISSSGSDSPFINRVKPKSINLNKETTIKVKGKNFADGVKTFIDKNEIATTFKSNMLLIVNFIFDTVGLHELKVQNPSGNESNVVNVKVNKQ